MKPLKLLVTKSSIFSVLVLLVIFELSSAKLELDLPDISASVSTSGGHTSSVTDQSPTASATTFDPASLQLEHWAAEHSQNSAGFVRNDQGCPVPSLTASLAIGQHGQALLQDAFLINKLAQFNRERLPERVVHAKGHGAFGYFRVTNDISTLTKADFLNGIGKVTPVLVRFSTVTDESGSSDTSRGGRGFAIKFYTNDGIFDLVGNGIGTFPIRDPILFNDVNKSRARNPKTHCEDRTMRWDYGSFRPEAIMHTLGVFSDFAANSRVLNCFGVHAFKFVNKEGAAVFIKFNIMTVQPFKWFNSTEIDIVAGIDPDYSTRDLFDAIATHQYPRWIMKMQVMTVEQALNYPTNPFDVTKVWRKEEFPEITVGELVLDRNPQEYFNDIEQAAFDPSRLVPGIEPSPDRMFHGRMFSYPDSQRYRLGVNFAQLEVNRPRFPVNNYDRDGVMRANPNGGGGPNYFPNSFHGPLVNGSAKDSVFHVKGIVDRFDTVTDVEDNFRLARLLLYKDYTTNQRDRVARNLAGSLVHALPEVRERALVNLFYRVSQDFGDNVRKYLDEDVAREEVEPFHKDM